jgi:EmrB/QacA subfamily drug resistance transporter
VTSYLLAMAVFVPLSGWLADRFGARPIFACSIIGFTLTSMACGLSETLTQLIFARVLQGTSAALMIPVGRLLLLRTFEKSRLMHVMTYISVPAMLGPVVGPPLGGLIVTHASWRWIFFINLPIGVLGLVLAAIFIRRTPPGSEPGPFDLRGFMLITFALATGMAAIETIGRGLIGTAAIILLLVGSAVGFLVYTRHARHSAAPIIDLGLLRIQTFTAAVMGGVFFRMVVGTMPFLLPLLFQMGFGMSPILSGVLTFASAAGAISMRVCASWIARRFGFRNSIIANLWLNAASCVVCALFQPGTPVVAIFVILLVGGLFRAYVVSAANTLAFADIPPERMSRATSFAGMMQQLSQSLGVALAAFVLHLTLLYKGSAVLGPDDFRPAFIVTGLFVLSGLYFFVPLPPDAGAEVSRHVIPRK